MNFVETITTPSQGLGGSLSGRLLINEGAGVLSVTEITGQERTRLDILGLTTIRSDGTYSNRVGQARDDLRDGIWSAKTGIDLVNEGIG